VRLAQSRNRGPLFLAVSDQGGPVNVTGTSAKLEEEERGENVVEPGKGQLPEEKVYHRPFDTSVDVSDRSALEMA